MMMSKPASEKKEEEKESSSPPAFATAPPPSTIKMGSVEDLERRLKMIDTASSSTGNDVETAKTVEDNTPKEPAAAKPAVAVPVSAAAVKGGKNALLARIMAAKEKSQQAKVAPAPPKEAPPAAAAPDLFMDFDAPMTEKDPPPSYDTNFLPTGTTAIDAPPAFDAFEQQQQKQPENNFPPPPPIDSVLPPPPPMDNVLPPPPLPENMIMAPSAPAASAPSFEDLLGGSVTQQNDDFLHPPPLPPPVQEESSTALDIDESILNALEPAEREAFLEEQRKIMEQIEKEKSSNNSHAPDSAATRAAAFNQRSSAAVAQVAASYEGRGTRRSGGTSTTSRSGSRPTASNSGTVNLGEGTEVPLHGAEKTQQAIKDGTAVIVQCMSCNNWMQVTEAAELMFCPICQVVCPVQKAGAATTADMEAAAQMAADAELAEKLQNEEYARAGGGNSAGGSSRRRQAGGPAPAPAASSSGDGQSWYDWLVGAPAPAPAASSGRSAEIRPQRGLIAAQTGEEGGVGRSRSYDESEGLIRGGGARVADQKSMFACVADSISTAATQMTAYNLSEDQEGNVHGVDSSSLLAMPDVSRQREEDS